MLESWFLNYDKDESARVDGWGNENDALNDIKKWSSK